MVGGGKVKIEGIIALRHAERIYTNGNNLATYFLKTTAQEPIELMVAW
jgi:hypothetical protein